MPSARICSTPLRFSTLPRDTSPASRSSSRSGSSPSAAGPLLEWLDRIMQAFDKSKWLAGEMLGLGERLIQDVREFSESINMRFLYDPERKLFAIGFNVSEGRLDSAFYDLLASEARLGSYVAIARGEVPDGALVRHGPALRRNRPAPGAAQLDRDHVRIPDAAAFPALLWELAAGQSRQGSRGDPDRLRPQAPGALGHLGVRLRGPGHQQDLSIQGLWRAGAGVEARPGGGARRRPLCHPAGGRTLRRERPCRT